MEDVFWAAVLTDFAAYWLEVGKTKSGWRITELHCKNRPSGVIVILKQIDFVACNKGLGLG